MTSLYQAMLSQSSSGQFLTVREVSRYSAAEIRQTIADLVCAEHIELADALAAAGQSLYPDSEDILAISALLAEIKQDWGTAEQMLTQLVTQQGDQATPITWRHLIRVLRCQFENTKALQVAKQATAAHPGDALLAEEFLQLQKRVSAKLPVEASTQMH